MTEALALKRGNEVRVIANLPGRYMLANKRNMKGDRYEFACRIGNVSSAATVLAAPGTCCPRVIVPGGGGPPICNPVPAAGICGPREPGDCPLDGREGCPCNCP